MKFKQLLLFMLSITVFSCSSESENPSQEEENNTDNTLLKKVIYNRGTDDEYTEIYNYDGNKLTSVDSGDGYKNVYTYDSNDYLIKDEYYESEGLVAYVDLEYNDEGKLAKYNEYFLEHSGLDDRKYEHIFTYNSDGTITSEVYTDYNDSRFELNYTETITFTGKNIDEISSDDGYKEVYGYDDKNGMFKNVHAIEILNILSENEFGSLIYGNTNNITSYVESDPSVSDNYNDKYEYTYNENNYPKTCIYSSIYGEDIEDVDTIEFFYE